MDQLWGLRGRDMHPVSAGKAGSLHQPEWGLVMGHTLLKTHRHRLLGKKACQELCVLKRLRNLRNCQYLGSEARDVWKAWDSQSWSWLCQTHPSMAPQWVRLCVSPPLLECGQNVWILWMRLYYRTKLRDFFKCHQSPKWVDINLTNWAVILGGPCLSNQISPLKETWGSNRC